MVYLSSKYLSCFSLLSSLKDESVHLKLNSPFDLPSVVARNYLKNQYYATRLSKTCVIVNGIAQVECNPLPLPTVYLFGPDLLGEKEAVSRSRFFISFPQDWRNLNGQGWSNEILALNEAKVPELTSQFAPQSWLQEVAEKIDQLASEEVIRLAYDVGIGRSKPDGSKRIVGIEAFSRIVVNTISRNFLRARSNRFVRDGLMCTPKGTVSIYDLENNINDGGFSNEDCLKIGPSNNLLTYLAVYFLNMSGWKANLRTLSYVLACKYLRSKSTLKKKTKFLKQFRSQETLNGPGSQIRDEEKEVKRLERYAFKFVKKSLNSLIDQGAIANVKGAYLALGERIHSSYGDIELDPHHYYNLFQLTLRNVSEIHKLAMKRTRSKHQVRHHQQFQYRRPVIYVASTCHDLRDLRIELAHSLREWGYSPLLNEDSDFIFPVKVKVNSYEACLEAVKASDCLVLIIGTRYGGEVGTMGISITELEYRTATELGIPCINFCLDKVWNLIQVRQNNPQLNYPRYFTESREKVDKLFRFLDYVRKYEQGKTDNWVHVFRNSLELKKILRTRFEKMKLRSTTRHELHA